MLLRKNWYRKKIDIVSKNSRDMRCILTLFVYGRPIENSKNRNAIIFFGGCVEKIMV